MTDHHEHAAITRPLRVFVTVPIRSAEHCHCQIFCRTVERLSDLSVSFIVKLNDHDYYLVTVHFASHGHDLRILPMFGELHDCWS